MSRGSDGTDFVNVSLLLTCTEPDSPCSPFFQPKPDSSFPPVLRAIPAVDLNWGRTDNAEPGDLELNLDYSLQPGDSMDLKFHVEIISASNTCLLFGTGFLT
jgi:hypothetical protein